MCLSDPPDPKAACPSERRRLLDQRSADAFAPAASVAAVYQYPRVFTENMSNPPSLWIGSNHGASIVKIEPLD